MSKNKRFAAVRGQQLRANCFVKSIEEFILVLPVSGRHQLIDSKGLTKHRRRAQSLVTLRTHAVQPISDCLFHTLRDHQVGKLATFPASAFSSHRALLYQRLHHLFDEERIALRFAIDGLGKVSGDTFV